jgi:hypothetical protein
MKIQIRRGVFETNSSSVHSLTMCSEEEYNKWRANDLVLVGYGDNAFCTRDEAIALLKEERHWHTDELLYADVDWENEEEVREIFYENDYLTFEKYIDLTHYDKFYGEYITKNGEKVIAFGHYGYDG